MSNITNSTSSSDGAGSVLASIVGLFVFLGFFYCVYKCCKNNTRQRFNTSKKAPVVQAYPYNPLRQAPIPVQAIQIPNAASVSIVDSDENRKIFFKNNNINLPCSKKDLDQLEKLMEAGKYRIIDVFYINTRGMYIIVQGEAYLLKYQFDENGELKQELENPLFREVPTIPKDPNEIYAGITIYRTYKQWKEQVSKQESKLNF